MVKTGETSSMSEIDSLRKLCRLYDAKHWQDLPENEISRMQDELEQYEFYEVDDHLLEKWREAQDKGAGDENKTNSLLAYHLGITEKKPEGEFDLVISKQPPDFDLDFDKNRTDELYEYLEFMYGEDSVAKIGAFTEYKPKAAFLDIVGVIGNEHQKNKAAKLSKTRLPADDKDDSGEWLSFSDMLDEYPDVEEFVEDIVDSTEHIDSKEEFCKIGDLMRTSFKQESLHPAGVVVSTEKLNKVVPTQRKEDEKKHVQLDMGDAESMGMCKIDLLALGSITVVGNVCDNVGINLKEIPLDDEEVFEFLDKGLYSGIFQLKSREMRRIVQESDPESIQNLAECIALIRPGPMGTGQHEKYMKIRQGLKAPEYPHEDLEPILNTTQGLLIFQEQVIRIATEIAGFTPEKADLMRRAIGKKKEKELKKYKSEFIQGCQDNKGWSEEEARNMWESISYHSQYSFNKCLAKDTMVKTTSGNVRIQELDPNKDEVFVYDSGEKHTAPIQEVIECGPKEVWEVEIDGENIRCSKDHKFMCVNEGSYEFRTIEWIIENNKRVVITDFDD